MQIKLPEQKINNEELMGRIRRAMSEDFEKKEGLMSKCLVFIKLYAPMSITDLQERIFKYYKKDIERVNIYRSCDELWKWGLIIKTTMGDLLLIPEEEKSDFHKHAESQHMKFLQKISPQLRNRYSNRNYVWINNFGEESLEWACKLNGFEYKK